jgi:alpha/beta superfamily hydrolase
MKTAIRSLCLAVAVFLVGCEAGDSRIDGMREAVVQPRSNPIGCGHSRAQLSPDGSMVALYVEPFRERFWKAGIPYPNWALLDVIGTECFARTGSWSECDVGRLKVFRGSVIDAYWSNSDNVLFVNSNSSSLISVRADLDQRSLKVQPVAIKLDRRVSSAYSIQGPVLSRDVEEEWTRLKNLESARDTLLYRKLGVFRYDDLHVSASGQSTAILGRKRRSIDLDIFLQSGVKGGESLPKSMLTLGGMRDLLRPISVHPGVDGSWWIVGGGDSLRRTYRDMAEYEWQPAARPGGFGMRAVMEADSGRMIGLHSESDILWLEPTSRLIKLTAAVQRQLGSAGVIHSMQISMIGGRAFALIQDISRGGVYSVFSWSDAGEVWRSTSLVCDSRDVIADVSAETLDVGKPGWRIPARWYRHPNSTRLLVFLHGGPESSLIGDGVAAVVRRYVPHGFDIVTFDYSGAVGVGFDISNRASVGARAWMKDADLIADYLRGSTDGYQGIALAAESFGALIAPTVIETLGSKLDSVSMGVPFFKYRSADELGRSGPRLVVSRLRDRQFLGLDADGIRELEAVMLEQQSRMKPDRRFLFYFGTKDEKSRIGDLSNRGVAVVELVDGGHDVASSYMSCWHIDLCRPLSSRMQTSQRP